MRKDNSNDDVLDLSEMIDEYDEDSELRRKIEAMKQSQKESDAQEAKQSYEQEEPQIYEAFTRSSYAAQNMMDEDIEAESDEADSYTEADFDKTRVVMEHPRYEAEETAEADDSVYLYDNHEVTEEEITEDDINEFLGEKKKTVAKPSMDADKMNKIVTGVIIGIVSLCLLIGVGFGIKAVFFNSNDDTPVTDTDKDKNDVEPNDDDDKPLTNDDDNEDDTNKPDDSAQEPKDNTKEIAEIKGKIEGNTKQIESYNKQIKEAEDIMDYFRKNYESKLADKTAKKESLESAITVIDKEIKDYEAQCSGEEISGDFCVSFDKDAKINEMNTLTNELTSLSKELIALEKKKKDFENASSRITELNREVTRLNNENKELQNKLSSLQ